MSTRNPCQKETINTSSRMGEEGKANALTDVSVSSMSDNLICPGSNLQKNMGNVLRENDDEIMKSMKMEKTGRGNGVNEETDGMIYTNNTNNNHDKSIQQPTNVQPQMNKPPLKVTLLHECFSCF